MHVNVTGLVPPLKINNGSSQCLTHSCMALLNVWIVGKSRKVEGERRGGGKIEYKLASSLLFSQLPIAYRIIKRYLIRQKYLFWLIQSRQGELKQTQDIDVDRKQQLLEGVEELRTKADFRSKWSTVKSSKLQRMDTDRNKSVLRNHTTDYYLKLFCQTLKWLQNVLEWYFRDIICILI